MAVDDPLTALVEAKAAKTETITDNTKTLLAHGYEYLGHTFPLTPDTISWFGTASVHMAAGYPSPLSLVNSDGDAIEFTTGPTCAGAVDAGYIRYREVIYSEGPLLFQVASATTAEDVDAITDDRLTTLMSVTPPPTLAVNKPKRLTLKLHCVHLGAKVEEGVCGSRLRRCNLFGDVTDPIRMCVGANRDCQSCLKFVQGEYKKPDAPPPPVEVVKPVKLTNGNGHKGGPRLLLSAAVGANGKKWLEITRPLMETYAAKCGAVFEVITDGDESYPLGEKWRIAEYLGRYDRVVFLDADVVVAPDAPDLFNTVPSTHVGVRDDWPWMCVDVGVNVTRAWMDLEVRAIRKAANRPGPLVSTCYNTGVLVLSSQHAGLFDPPKVPLPKFHCTEQHWFNLNVLDQQPAVYELPWELHWHPFIDRKRERTEGVKVWHFAGEADRAELLRRKVAEYPL